MMKFSPHSFLTGADFVLGVLNEWNESTLLWENDLFCIVPLGWLSRLSFKNHFVDFVTVATGTLLPSSFAPPKVSTFSFVFVPLSCSLCVFPSPFVSLTQLKLGVPQQPGRWCVKSFCPVSLSALSSETRVFYYGTHDIFYRFSGSINTETKLRNRLFWKPKKNEKKTSF